MKSHFLYMTNKFRKVIFITSLLIHVTSINFLEKSNMRKIKKQDADSKMISQNMSSYENPAILNETPIIMKNQRKIKIKNLN